MADQSESSQNVEGTVVVSNVVGGTTARIGTILNVDKGTLTRLEGGSIVQTAGTLTTGSLTNIANLGTLSALNRRPPQVVTSFGTKGTASGSFFGTLSSVAGAGTIHMISGCSAVVESGTTDVRILIGTSITGTTVLTAGKFVPSAGIVRDFNPPIETGTNSELTYHFVGAGTAFITVQYWKKHE